MELLEIGGTLLYGAWCLIKGIGLFCWGFITAFI